jgi:hypothetical protein
LKEWGAGCERAIVLAMPKDVRSKWLRVKDDSGIVESDGGFRVNEIIRKVWTGIREGERKPKGSAMFVSKAVYEVMYSDEEKRGERTLIERDPKYQLEDIFGRERELPTAFISPILKTIYAKRDIFDTKFLQVKELEEVMEHLELFRAKDEISRSQFTLYANKLAGSMEMFGEYLWKLEGWPNKRRKPPFLGIQAINMVLGGLEVPVRAFCCKAIGGGGRLRHATEREEREEARERSLVYMYIIYTYV